MMGASPAALQILHFLHYKMFIIAMLQTYTIENTNVWQVLALPSISSTLYMLLSLITNEWTILGAGTCIPTHLLCRDHDVSYTNSRKSRPMYQYKTQPDLKGFDIAIKLGQFNKGVVIV